MAADSEGQTSGARAGRSPGRFARLRQTRVASLSPTPTLIGSNSASRSRSRSTQRGPGQLIGASSDGHGQSGRRFRSVSRARGSPSADTNTLVESEERNTKGSDQASDNAQPPSSTDLEKGMPPVVAQSKNAPKDADTPKKSAVERHLPRFILHFLGYRRPASELHPKQQSIKPYPSVIPGLHKIPLAIESLVWMFLGSFVGIAAVQLIFARPRHFTSSIDVPPHEWAAPIIIGSFGASSVLLYAAPASPLGQPRCFVGGQTFSAIAGVAMTKLIKLAGPYYYNLDLTDTSHSLVWVAGALATGAALVTMTVTGTLHPPGGATAVLCATNMQVERMGWKIIPVVLVSSLVMLLWSLIFMNLGRKRFPESFFAPSPPTGANGNLSQYVIDWIQAKTRQRKEEAANAKQRDAQVPAVVNLQHSSDAGASTMPQKAAWQDEGPWIPSKQASKSSPTRANGNGEHPEVIDEDDEPSAANSLSRDNKELNENTGDAKDAEDAAERVERPSRWANAPTRSTHG